VPVQASFVSVALNLALNLLFIGPLRFLGLEHLGLALATSVTSIGNMLQLGFYLRRRVGLIEGRRMVTTVVRVGLAGALVVLVCGLGLVALGERWQGHLLREAAVVLGAFVFALAAGFGLMKLLRVEELRTAEELVALMAGRFRRRREG
jgi:peptidoglycan biosynthesis protein MviN/MurJ (putative lipid II flippase)